ncbi:MAG TPA: MBL fold metallo-hydrolase [Actinotalea sp.]|nr:MBL fold metallo-hydrolase [Actinotalea sp.]
MRLTVVGCAGSFPGPRSAASCYLVQAEDAEARTWNLLLDLGSGALGPLQHHVDPAELDAVALSHLHPDHMADLCGLYVYLRYRPADPHGSASVGPGRRGAGGRVGARRGPLPVYGPFGTSSRLAEAYGLDPGESMAEQLVVHTWQAGYPVQVGPLTVTPLAVRHPVPAYGIRVQGPAEGDPTRRVTLGYTGDTDACPGLDELAEGADALLAEASFVEGRDDAYRGIHLTGRRAGEAAERGGSGALVLTHIPAWNNPDVALAEAREAYGGPVALAVPGLILAL